MISHVSIQCSDVHASSAFYDAVLAPMGGRRIIERSEAIGYGVPPRPDFWIGPWETGDGFRESHIAFAAQDRAAVRAFFDAAKAAGAEVLHEPGVWPDWGIEVPGSAANANRDRCTVTRLGAATRPSPGSAL